MGGEAEEAEEECFCFVTGEGFEGDLVGIYGLVPGLLSDGGGRSTGGRDLGGGNQLGVKIYYCAAAVAGICLARWRWCGLAMAIKWKKVVMGCGMGRGK